MKKEEYYATRRDDLIACVPDSVRRLLDVGCGIGLTGKALKAERAGTIEVTGIEVIPSVAEKARTCLDRVIVGDVEDTLIDFEKGYFDCIVYGDVLEHLVDPLQVLMRHGAILRENGFVIASIPNIAHYRVMKMLLKKEWEYREWGVLDSTHLRFFTIKSIRALFREAGLEIIEVRRKISASKSKKVLNMILFGAISDFLTEQYIVIARKTGRSL